MEVVTYESDGGSHSWCEAEYNKYVALADETLVRGSDTVAEGYSYILVSD